MKDGQMQNLNIEIEFWCRGYYVDTVGKITNKIKMYIQNQLKEYHEIEQL